MYLGTVKLGSEHDSGGLA